MPKYIFLADTHIKGINPINRKGDYYKDVMIKIAEVISIAKEKEVNAIVHCGDLYDSPNVSNLMIDEFIDMIEASEIKWYIVPGNHDEIGHNWDLSKGSSLAHIFRRSKMIKQLTLLYSENGVINGFPYYHNIESDISEKGLMCSHPDNPFKIAVTHAMITKKKFPFQVMHVLEKDIKTDFNVVICSHYHLGCSINELNGVKFLKLPAIGRTGIDEHKIVPKVALIDTETRQIDLIPLKSAKKGDEVFDLEKVEIAKAFEGEIDNFIKSLDSTKLQSLDIKGLVEMLAKEKNVDEEVRKEVIKRIGENENG